MQEKINETKKFICGNCKYYKKETHGHGEPPGVCLVKQYLLKEHYGKGNETEWTGPFATCNFKEVLKHF